MKKLENKVAVLTGATSGMALATAKLFVEEGAFVYITGRRKEQLEAAIKEIGRNVKGVQADSGSLADLDRLYETIKKDNRKIDVLFASAGTGKFNITIEGITEEEYESVFGVNVKGTIFTVQKALPIMVDGGSIILNGSIAIYKAFPMGVYNASKAALRTFVRNWTVDLKGRGIRVNLLSPGHIDTPIFAEIPQQVIDGITQSIPMGRFGKDKEIATAALFLASSDSSYVTGTELFVDGGVAQV